MPTSPTVPADLTLSPAVADLVHGGTWTPLAGGPRSRVWQVTFADGRPDVVLKTSGAEPVPGVTRLADEARRAGWARPAAEAVGLAVPTVVAFDDTPWPVLVSTLLPGEVDLRLLGSSERAVGLLGRALAAIHRIPVSSCPFDASLDAFLTLAEERVAAGLIDPEDLQPGLQPIAPERLLDHARTMAASVRRPDTEADVVVHGDLCVTNVLADPATGEATGVLDWGRCGVGDRHRDLAVTARSVIRNFGGEALPGLFAAYGDPSPDPLRLELYALLEELS